MSHFAILFLALITDRLVGDPDRLWRRATHPVVLFGKLVAFCDSRFNRPDKSEKAREAAGLASIAVLLILMLVVGGWLGGLLAAFGWIGAVVEIAVVAVFLAQKSLADHVGAVADGLRDGGLAGGRSAVSMIVGRDPATLDEAGVSRAAIESIAENASDGVIAPAFWYALLGLPGLLAYKMLNTADSMIGHKSDAYRAFGRASAKLDDLANWVPARLTGALIVTAAYTLHGLGRARKSWTVMRRDAHLHRSPNAGWPEAAMAGALGISLGGPRIYAGDVADEPFMHGEGKSNAGVADIDSAIGVFWRTMTVLAGVVAVIALLT